MKENINVLITREYVQINLESNYMREIICEQIRELEGIYTFVIIEGTKLEKIEKIIKLRKWIMTVLETSKNNSYYYKIFLPSLVKELDNILDFLMSCRFSNI